MAPIASSGERFLCCWSAAACHSDYLQVKRVSFKPPGTEATILNNVSFSLPEKRLGLITGRSGSGKTTLLQILAGLASPTQGSIVLGGTKGDTTVSLTAKVGLVFQFPERLYVFSKPTNEIDNLIDPRRYFLTDSILEELSFGWPSKKEDFFSRQLLAMRVQAAVAATGLASISWNTNPRALSDGFKRRLALAVQLVRMPELLLLDEPLAGLDWQSRSEIAKLLNNLKKERTLLVVSHDLRELIRLVDKAWVMDMGGTLVEQLNSTL
ncbi:ABC transporter I family member 11, chloroplastic isoform X1 [Selaginella moellendorffii]|uniref:ABC transporter I family member 11, chloroplastic isoform X1 n=1 Tax=Selaginella moellendorffii TaxID=88036 RepID=UPI000D1CBC31|nr:ABC transporter I family member 11, chloroplastic isoform X1 [Selaginella moellendorffii]|eukprot:XP_024525929.1 ABC transporter I family member 11, chloroplastic isoform X1 [Selaginella moellendorffii]